MKIENIGDLKAALRQGAYAWPGGYPCYFITADGSALSFQAVKDNYRAVSSAIRRKDDASWRTIAFVANWEDSELYCDATGERIPSAYADDKVNDHET